jgi:histidyl-tRNA synthetase
MPPTPFQRPTGTRDFYPIELARRRWIEDRWRRVSVRHGFEEIEGPVFEHLDLYRLKSGEGIVSELFQAFSGKDEAEIARIRQSGQAPFALRPEFTPTLARMYAAKAGALPKPTKWFSILNYFRAERPQRGRLREFLQWNVDVIGLDVAPERANAEGAEGSAEIAEAMARMDAECIACCVQLLESLGLAPTDVQVRLSDRRLVNDLLETVGVAPALYEQALALLDRRDRLSPDQAADQAEHLGLGRAFFIRFDDAAQVYEDLEGARGTLRQQKQRYVGLHAAFRLWDELEARKLTDWCNPFDMRVVRGLAYYTGTVFEVIAEGERAVAGGGRYDKLIELLGGPPTPAVGFAMGDVVLSLLLQDKGLMPSDDQIARDLNFRPDVFILPSPAEGAETLIAPTLALLRKEGLHARRSYKSTRNVGKLLKDAAAAGARLAVILESPAEFTLKNLDSNEQTDRLPIDRLLETIREQ